MKRTKNLSPEMVQPEIDPIDSLMFRYSIP